MLEYVNHLHEHFKYPVVMKGGHYMPPQVASCASLHPCARTSCLAHAQDPGYSVEMFPASLDEHEYPNGPLWQKLFASGQFKAPEY